MKIVAPPFWYMAFWILVFLPCFCIVACWVIRFNEEATYRATRRALEEIVKRYGPLPLFHEEVGE